jgi:hypothetical protein
MTRLSRNATRSAAVLPVHTAQKRREPPAIRVAWHRSGLRADLLEPHDVVVQHARLKNAAMELGCRRQSAHRPWWRFWRPPDT